MLLVWKNSSAQAAALCRGVGPSQHLPIVEQAGENREAGSYLQVPDPECLL